MHVLIAFVFGALTVMLAYVIAGWKIKRKERIQAGHKHRAVGWDPVGFGLLQDTGEPPKPKTVRDVQTRLSKQSLLKNAVFHQSMKANTPLYRAEDGSLYQVQDGERVPVSLNEEKEE